MQEKKQKKIKASGMPAKFWDFLMALMYPANFPALGRGPFLALRRVPLRGLTLFSCLDARKEARKEDSERKEPLIFSSDYLFSFLDERKEAKENQAITDGLFSPGT